jgi:hypothetical protein
MPDRSLFSYRRTELAKSFCDALEGRGVVDATSGLFLAAPRRIGKSTFLREDLIPEMIARGWLPIYVDLWGGRDRDPADLIAAAIKKASNKAEGLLRHAVKQVRLDKLRLMGAVSLDFSESGPRGGPTMVEALSALHDRCGKPIALLVDEGQHALSSDAGLNAMFELKSARDQLNQGSPDGRNALHIVMTGSNRDKLAHLVARRTEPFYGANVTRFPLLDKGFVAAYAAWVNRQFKDDQQFSVDALEEAFALSGRRPEMLKTLVGEVVTELGGPKGLDDSLARNGAELQKRFWRDFEAIYSGLTPNQKAVFDVVARLSPDFEPFSEAAQKGYQAVLGQPLGTSGIQVALNSLRDQEILWRAGRGDYAFEDDGLRNWYLSLHEKPPLLSAEAAENGAAEDDSPSP